TKTGGQASGVPVIAVTGTDAADFTAMNDCTVALAPGASCTIIGRFAPSTMGAKTATLGASATPGGAASTALSATGIADGLVISPPIITYAATPTDASSTPYTFLVRNTGATAITDLAFAATDPAFARAAPPRTDCGTTLAAGA